MRNMTTVSLALLLGAAPAPSADLLIRHATIVDVVSGKLVKDQAVAVKGGDIVASGGDAAVAPRFVAAKTIDATGRYVMPGLWDMHVHFGGGPDLTAENKALLPVYIEYFTSVLWAYTMATVMLLWLAGQFIEIPEPWHVNTMIPGWHGVVIGSTCLLQFGVSMFLDRRYEQGLGKHFYWMIWYPLAFWALNVFTTLVAVPRVLLRGRQRATWISPDRGLRASDTTQGAGR